MTGKLDNEFIPKYILSDLKWYEREGLDTWYLEEKCKGFLGDTDKHFKNTKIVNFDIMLFQKINLCNINRLTIR